MPTLVNLTFDIADLIGADFDVRRTKVWIETNIASGSVIDTTGKVVRLGDVKATVGTDGKGTFTGLFATNSADLNPTGFLYQASVDYATRADGRKLWSSGWFPLTASSDLALVAPVVGGPVNSTEDAVIASRVNDPASQTRAALNARYVGNTTGALGGTATPELYRSSAIDPDGPNEDWSPAIQAALNAGYRSIEFSARYYTCRAPIDCPDNSGVRFFSRSAKKGSVLNFFIPAGNDARGAIEYTSVTLQSAGISIENVHIRGNDSVCHGIYLKYVSHPNIRNTLVEGFKGAGLLCDWVQDGVLDIDVQDCGRTTGNYALLADRSNNALTTYAPIHFIATTDNCNMLRISGQHEQNKVSPYVWVNNPGAIGLWFDKIHAEVRETGDFNSFDYLVAAGGDMEFTNMAVSSTFREGFLLRGAGRVVFKGGRSLRTVKHTVSGVNGTIVMSDAFCGDVSWVSLGGQHKFANSELGNVTITDPANGPSRFVGCTAGNVSVTGAGSGEAGVHFDDCTLASYTTATTANLQALRNSKVTGALNAQAANSQILNITAGSITNSKVSDTFTAPTLLNSWVQTSVPPYSPVGYHKDAAGYVHIRGYVNSGVTDTVIFVLPLGHRPAYIWQGTNIEVHPNGDVKSIGTGARDLNLTPAFLAVT